MYPKEMSAAAMPRILVYFKTPQNWGARNYIIHTVNSSTGFSSLTSEKR